MTFAAVFSIENQFENIYPENSNLNKRVKLQT